MSVVFGGDSGGENFLKETIVLKLNGGLGTSMGLDKAKSLLPVKGEETFLDLTAKQVRIIYKYERKKQVFTY